MYRLNYLFTSFVLLISFIYYNAFPIEITVISQDSKEQITVDSFKQDNKEYLHLPTLILKLNGTINIEENKVNISLENKKIVVNLQSNYISLSDGMTSKFIQLQNTPKIWQDTIWLEKNDAYLLLQTVTGKNLSPETGISEITPVPENEIETVTLKPLTTEDIKNETINNKFEEKEPVFEEIKVEERKNEEEGTKGTINKIIIDAGHGGEDKGILFPSGKYEKDITLIIANKLEATLTKNNLKNELIRNGDNTISIKDRMNRLQKNSNEFYIGIHADMPKEVGEGLRIFIPKSNNENISKTNELFAELLIKKLGSKQNKINIEMYYSPLYINDVEGVAGILIEVYPGIKENTNEEEWNTFLGDTSDFTEVLKDTFIELIKNKEGNNKGE